MIPANNSIQVTSKIQSPVEFTSICPATAISSQKSQNNSQFATAKTKFGPIDTTGNTTANTSAQVASSLFLATVFLVFFAACLCVAMTTVAMQMNQDSPLTSNWINSQLTNYRSSNQEIRAQASLALVNTGKAAVPDLILTLDDTDPSVRRLAAETLGALGETAHTSAIALTNKLDDSDLQVRLTATRALSSINSLDAIQGLILALKNHEVQVRATAVIGLALYNGPSRGLATKPLTKATQDSDAEIRNLASASLNFVKEREAIDGFTALQ